MFPELKNYIYGLPQRVKYYSVFLLSAFTPHSLPLKSNPNTQKSYKISQRLSFLKHLPHHPCESVGRVNVHHWLGLTNPYTQKSYKISQRLSPKHAASGVAQSPYPIYSHGKACLSKQLPWRAAGDPRLACGRSRV